MRTEVPATYAEMSEVLADSSRSATAVRFRGAGTKSGWGGKVEADVDVSSEGLASILEHNAGDLTAVVQAGVKLSVAQAAFEEAGQMLSIDPPRAPEATIGGVLATADSGPLRHRYGTMRDLILGITVVLSDGTIARSGGKVIKNVAGYDIAKLFTGAFGTLGMIVEVALRLHPRPQRTVTVRSASDEPASLAMAASALAHLPLEMDSLDISWGDGGGEVLARFAGAAPEGRADAAVRALGGLGAQASIEEDDGVIWEAQRSAQRAGRGALARVSVLPSEMPAVMAASLRCVGRAGMGVFYVHITGEDLVGTIEELRRALGPAQVVVFDAPDDVRTKVDVWGSGDEGAVGLMRRIKSRFDPAGICNPGIFVGGI
jgi:glycolate oxidase FAD binding subunit